MTIQCLFLFFLSVLCIGNALEELPIVIVIPSYNNAQWHAKNLQSVLHQHYSNYRILYVNDASQDGTDALVEEHLRRENIDFHRIDLDCDSSPIEAGVLEFAASVNAHSHFFTLVHNKKRAGALANLYRMIHSCKDAEIVVTVDGDDWLANDAVLSVLNETYQSGEVWFTHGTIKEYPWGHVAWSEPITSRAIEKNTIRKFKCPSHLRTFYAGLFKKILLKDFLYEGEFFSMAWDMAIMFPLAEMAAERHAFIKQVLYIYNMSNPINDNKVNAELQNAMDAWIRQKKPYKRLTAP